MLRPKALKIAAVSVCAALLLTTGLGTWNVLQPIPPAVAAISRLPGRTGSASLSWPAQGEAAITALGYGNLGSNGDNKALPIASVAKVITALAVLEKAPLQAGESGPTYTITADDVARYHDYVARDGSMLAVTEGEQLTEYQALQALMLPSANNIADSLAVWVFGSLSAYKTYALQMVAGLGMNSTAIGADASGLSPDTTSTPADLVLLGKTALANQVLSQIMQQSSAALPMVGTVHNVNTLLGTHGIVGIKTGNSDEAGGCLLFAAKQTVSEQEITVVGAVMGVPDLSSALSSSATLIDSAFANFSKQTPITAGQVMGTYALPWGGTATAVAKDTVSFVAWNGDTLKTTASLRNFTRAQVAGAPLGSARVVDGQHTFKTSLVTKTAVAGPSFWWKLTRRP